MPYVGESFRIYYSALDFTTGLTDVVFYVFKPDGSKLGPYDMTEFTDVTARGIYYGNFSGADVEGNYMFCVNSATKPKFDAKSYFFESRIFTPTQSEELIEKINFIHSIEGGKWQIINNQMVFYADDNTTEIARFDLFNSSGDPAMTNIYRRDRHI